VFRCALALLPAPILVSLLDVGKEVDDADHLLLVQLERG
jgi:hypothetical protein